MINLMRQSDIVNTDRLNLRLCVVGAGAIGSYTTLNLAKMGYGGEITVYDDDTVADHNIPNQFYPTLAAITARSKVQALAALCNDFAEKLITANPTKLEAIPDWAEAVLFAVDSMDPRIQLYKSMPQSVRWLFDGRMGAEIMRIYTIDFQNPKDREIYEGSLYTTAEAEQLPCTARSVIYNVSVVAGLLANQVKRAMMGEPYVHEITFALRTLELLKS